MAVTVTLTERTPNKLAYKLVGDGQSSSYTIPNALGATPDLRTDAAVENESPIDDLVETAVVDQAAARKLLNGEGLTAVGDINTARGHLSIKPISGSGWGADANVSGGFAVITGSCPATSDSAIVELLFDHTIVR